MILRRKLYDRLLEWKRESNGSKAILIEGARRIGKSTICETFGKNEYASCLVVDFAVASSAVKGYFNRIDDLDTFYMLLSTAYGVELKRRESLIVFDEVQWFPKAREAIKYLVADGRYDFIETGSLISIKENVRDIVIPSEERHLKMYPLDFEEFCWALGEAQMVEYIRSCFAKRAPLERSLHDKAMLLFKQYMLVGGITSSSGEWSGNIYDFYFRVYNKIAQDIRVPFKLEGGDRIDDTPVHKALREALANCMINADYYGRQGVVIVKERSQIVLSNPGGFRIDIEAAKSGGVSDPRNAALIKMFNLVNIGERAGSGIPNIYSVWKKQGWKLPVLSERYDPDRITLSLAIEKTSDKKVGKKSSDKKVGIKGDDKRIASGQKRAIISYLTDHIQATSSELSILLGVGQERTRRILRELVAEEIIVTEGANRNRIYRLKA